MRSMPLRGAVVGLHAGNFLVRSAFLRRLPEREFPPDGTGARRHQLRRDDWLFGAPLFQFLLLTLALALVLPVFPAISQRQHESEARGCPQFNRREREGGGEIERDGENRRADNVCARQR
jgi:hypothetical protein